MAGNLSHGEVKSIVKELECSPSKSDSTGRAGGKPSAVPGGGSGGQGKTGGGGERVSGFHEKVKKGRR